jgi:HK97 family phage major capsid protein
MNEKELKELQLAIQFEQKKQTEAIEALKTASTKQAEDLIKKLDKSESDIKTLSEQADKLALQLKDQSRMGKTEHPFAEMKKVMTDKSVLADLKKGGQRTFEIKTSQIDLATELGNGTTDISAAVVVPFREAGIVKAPDRIPRLLDLVNRANINSNRVAWVERTARTVGISTNAYAAIAEGNPYIQSDFTWNQKFAPVEKIGTYVKCTNETLEDWDQLYAQIVNELIPMVERALELEVYSGTGTSPQMQGINDVCAAYTATAISGIVTPNTIDAIRACVAQIRNANFEGQLTALVNPFDAAMIDMPKNTDGIYLLPPMLGPGGRNIGGCRVVESNMLTAGYMLVGDFSRDTLFTHRGIEVKIWDQEASDAI